MQDTAISFRVGVTTTRRTATESQSWPRSLKTDRLKIFTIKKIVIDMKSLNILKPYTGPPEITIFCCTIGHGLLFFTCKLETVGDHRVVT